MIDDGTIEQIRQASHGDPFAVLGAHADASGRRWLRAFLPGARHVELLDAGSQATGVGLERRHADGFFEAELPESASADYRLRVLWENGATQVVDDPYRFPPVLGELDVWLLGEGTHLRPYEVMCAAQRP